ncbi:MAG: hypothetical protein AAE985_05870 [Thermoplasmataceae archaeon]|jgi:hypothetical protein|nr:MAG: hypothetical protein AMDU2_EPLC00006G0123 [Thermoplasmatales archaeon E-plasma]
MAKAKQNPDHIYIPQFYMALLFDVGRYNPVFLKTLYKSMRDVKSHSKVLQEIDFHGGFVLFVGMHHTILPRSWVQARILSCD